MKVLEAYVADTGATDADVLPLTTVNAMKKFISITFEITKGSPR